MASENCLAKQCRARFVKVALIEMGLACGAHGGEAYTGFGRET